MYTLAYEKPKILLNYVEHTSIKYLERFISLTNVVSELIIKYNTFTVINDKIIYDYSSFFSKTCCMDNIFNMKPRLEKTLQQLKLQRKNK